MSDNLEASPEHGELLGYWLEQQLWESPRSRVWRARRPSDRRAVILKVTNEDHPKPERVGRFRREYELTQRLGGDGVPQPLAFERLGRGALLIFADNGGIACDRLLAQEGPLAPVEATQIALAVARILAHLHGDGLIHKDVNPSNIIRNRDSNRVELIDFELASELGREDAAASATTALEGTLAYIAPEQTGRMNRLVDYRADFYGLGASLFALLSGRPPFTAEDPLALVHSHLAVTPPAVTDIAPGVPDQLGRIVAKLLAKAPEDRYQSAAALVGDLQTCFDALRNATAIPSFEPASADIPASLQIPQKLYGREETVAALQAGFAKAAQGSRATVLVTGEPGIGKSAVVRELYKQVTAEGGYFLAGKFDQLQRDRPYSALIQAFNGLIQHLLAESEAALTDWRAAIQAALGPNGGVLVQLIPDIAAIIGNQPQPPALDPQGERNRFNDTLSRFVGAVVGPGHPLVLFLDDLQWADTASLALIRTLLLDPELGHLYVMGAYRANEVDENHPLARLAQELGETEAAPAYCHLAGLAEADIARLLAETLNAPTHDVAELAQQAHAKTLGNPFFLERLLARWADDGLLWPDRAAGCWRWDPQAIAGTEMADNVVDLMAEKLRRLPGETQHMLALGAVVGGEVDLANLAVVAQDTPASVLERLWPAIQADVIRPVDGAYKYVGEAGHSGHARLRFRHDRVQQAALDLLDTAAYRDARLRTGQLLLAEITDPASDDRLFEALGHLNAVREEIADAQERHRLAGLNLTAGERAQRAAAYGPAQGFLTAGLALLGEASWDTDRALALALTERQAETAFMLGELGEMRRLSEQILAQARDAAEAAGVRELRIQAHVFEGNPGAAIDEGLAGLAQLGLSLPESPGKPATLVELVRTKRLLRGRDIARQAEQAELTDSALRAMMGLLAALTAPAYLARPGLFPIIVMRQVRLAFTHGNHPSACYAFAAYGLLLWALGRPVSEADRFARLAQDLLGRLEAERYRCATDFVVCYFIDAWQEDLPTIAERLRDIHDEGLRSGDLQFAAYAAHCHGITLTMISTPLGEAEAIMARNRRSILKIGQHASADILSSYQQYIHQLYNDTAEPAVLNGPHAHEDTAVEQFRSQANYTALFGIALARVLACYHYEALDEVGPWLATMRATVAGVQSTFGYVRALATDAAVTAAIAAEGERGQTRQARRWAQRQLGRVDKILGKIGNANMFSAHRGLAAAELRGLEGRFHDALTEFEAAVAGAEAHGYHELAGLARERAARLQARRGMPRLALAYIQEALGNYAQWQAYGKTAFLQRRYGLLASSSTGEAASTSAPSVTAEFTHSVTSEGEHDLDLEAVMRAAQTISQEIRPARLAETLMRVVGQTAGATHGCLLLGNREAELQPQAMLDTDGSEDVTVFDAGRGTNVPAAADLVPMTVARYALRRQEPVAVDDPAHARSYSYDPYIQTHRPGSVLCLPLVNQGRVTGLLYVEHRGMAGAFPEQRSTILGLLSAQMAVSLENAQLYSDMEAQVAARTRELEQTAEALRAEKGETERAHRVIQDSLENARRMQRAALPEATAADMGLADLATIWEPRDQVGGDFYRLAVGPEGRQSAVVLMDCTGHGVPGALLSFVASSAADRALAEATDWDPAALLQRLDTLVRTQLHGIAEAQPRGASAATDDGLEAAICTIERGTGRLRFAGAGIDLFSCYRNQVAVTRGARGALGYRSFAAPTVMTTTTIETGADTHVLVTDGILEQPGGPKGLQLGRRRFARMLADTRGAGDLAEQTRRLREAIEIWQGNDARRDDMTLIGLAAGSG